VAFSWPDAKGLWEVETIVEYVGGRPELVGLTIRRQQRSPAIPLTSKVLKQLHVPELVAGHLRFLRYQEHFDAEDLRSELGGHELTEEEWERKMRELLRIQRSHQPETLGLTGRPREWTVERLEEVARTYREALEARKHPTLAVAARFDRTPSGAAKLVRLARARGLLGKTTQGKAGWSETTPRKGRQGAKERKR
jgi:hypothetical protein